MGCIAVGGRLVIRIAIGIGEGYGRSKRFRAFLCFRIGACVSASVGRDNGVLRDDVFQVNAEFDCLGLRVLDACEFWSASVLAM